MYEVVWQYDETTPFVKIKPSNPAEAQRTLLEGNQAFADFFAPQTGTESSEIVRKYVRVSPLDVGLSESPGIPPLQEPFAAFLSCADARVPVELIFGQRANDLFVVRIAGNILGNECVGSLDYAIAQLGSIRLVGVLGHTGCGAVTAAVDIYLQPDTYLGVATNLPLESIISKLMGPVRGAAVFLERTYGDGVERMPGYRQALLEMTVLLNAALSADVLHHTYRSFLNQQLQVVFGVYNLEHRTVGLPGLAQEDEEWQNGLFEPPRDSEEFTRFGNQTAACPFINRLLNAQPVG
ncbi:MAG: carbonic anhydrase [Chloroflexota bacterium]|jgi:carbonic anhydrase